MKKATELLALSEKSPSLKAEKLVELQAVYKQIKPEIDRLKEDLLVTMQESKTLSLKTEDYTISRAKKVTPRVVDFDALKKYLKKNKIPFETKEVFHERMGLVFKALIDEGREAEGLEGLLTEYISIRVREEKK